MCQSFARIPPEIVSTTEPSALTSPVPTTTKVPASGSNDHRSVSLPGARLSMLGNVIGAGVAKVTPTGWSVMSIPGCRFSGSAAGASASGTKEMEISPVKLLPSGFLAVLGGTVSSTPSDSLVTTVVVPGSTGVRLSTAILGRKNGRSTTFLASGMMSIFSRKPA